MDDGKHGASVTWGGLELERDTCIARRAQELAEVGRAKDPRELGLVRGDPVGGRECADRAQDVLLHDEHEHAGEQALEQVEQVGDGAHGMAHDEDVAVEDHLPLDPPVGIEEGGGVRGEAETQVGTARDAALGAHGVRGLDVEEYAAVERHDVPPTVTFHQLVPDPEDPVARSPVGRSEGVSRCERNARALGPFVHVGHVVGEEELWRCGARGHYGSSGGVHGEKMGDSADVIVRGA